MATRTIQQASLTDMLREEHRRMRDLFAEFESGDAMTRERASLDIIEAIYAHDQVERNLLYPNAAGVSGETEDVVLRSKEAHHIANILLMELMAMRPGPRYYAKVAKLIEGIRSHIQEEETRLFPALERSDVDLNVLGARMIDMKERLDARGMPRVDTGLTVAVAVTALIGVGFLAYSAFASKD